MAQVQRARGVKIAQLPLACATSASPKVSHDSRLATVRLRLTIRTSLRI
jgi:hypothetical protein